MKDAIYIASCPVCGRTQFKGKANSYVETGCPKCGNLLKISFSEKGFKVDVEKKTTSA